MKHLGTECNSCNKMLILPICKAWLFRGSTAVCSLHSIHSKKRIIENLLSVVKSLADGFIHLLTNPKLLQTNLEASSGLISLDFFNLLQTCVSSWVSL